MPNKKTYALTKEDYTKVITAMKEGGRTFRKNERIATALVLEANLGLRIGDILHLTMDRIVKDGERLRLDVTEEKTGKLRTFTVPYPIYQYIENYCLRNGIGKGELMFPLTERAVQKYLGKVTEELGMENIGTHSFRKFYATDIYVNNGYNIILVQQLLQHSSPAVTQRYIGLSGKDVEAAITGHMELL